MLTAPRQIGRKLYSRSSHCSDPKRRAGDALWASLNSICREDGLEHLVLLLHLLSAGITGCTVVPCLLGAGNSMKDFLHASKHHCMLARASAC